VRVAREVKIAPAWLSQMADGTRPIPPRFAHKLKTACEGQVEVWDLLPTEWHEIWPELVGSVGAPEVAHADSVAQGDSQAQEALDAA